MASPSATFAGRWGALPVLAAIFVRPPTGGYTLMLRKRLSIQPPLTVEVTARS